MKCWSVFLVVVLLAIPLTAQIQEEDAFVIVYRPNIARDHETDPTIYLITAGETRRLAQMAKGEFFALKLVPGSYALSWVQAPSRNQILRLNLASKAQVFVRVEGRTLTLSGVGEAPRDLLGAGPIARSHVFDDAVLVPEQRVLFADSIDAARTSFSAQASPDQTSASSAVTPITAPSLIVRAREATGTGDNAAETPVPALTAAASPDGRGIVTSPETRELHTLTTAVTSGAPSIKRLTNEDILKLVRAGFSSEIILATIKISEANFETTPDALVALKEAQVSDPVILAMLEATATVPPSIARDSATGNRIRDELTTIFQELETTVVTVWSEFGHGTGFIFDASGLILTNQHVIGPSRMIAVQYDERHKVEAILLAADPEKDVAILWADISVFPNVSTARLAPTDAGPPVLEGERVFTIGSPLSQRKIMTTGLVSRVEPRAILSDININHGNSGGPLFNSLGEVAGITTFVERGVGSGVSGIVRIEEAAAAITEALAKMESLAKPSSRLLPVDPVETFPLDAIKATATAEKFDEDPYFVEVGDYKVSLFTPTLQYRLETQAEREAARTRSSRNSQEGAIQGTFEPFENFFAWREYVGDYKPILLVRATPEMGESFWDSFGRGLAGYYGVVTPARLRFKADFYKMRLFCGDMEIEPIHPGKVAHILNERNVFVSIQDATYEGLYSYPADAISPSCGTVTMELFSEKNPEKPAVRQLSNKTVERIASDFEPYLGRP